ncbi:MAG: hypothetical protein WAM58_16765 [Candidatus Acidiferrum sp.]
MSHKSAKPSAMKLKPRQIKFAEYIMGGVSLRDAALIAGYSEGDLRQLDQCDGKPTPSASSDRMNNYGMNVEDFIRYRLIPRLSATKKMFVRYKGEITQVMEVPDGKTRLSAVDDALRLLGAYPPKARKARKLKEGDRVQRIIADPPPLAGAQVPNVAAPQIPKQQEVQPPDNTHIARDPRPPDGVDALEYFARNKKSGKQ